MITPIVPDLIRSSSDTNLRYAIIFAMRRVYWMCLYSLLILILTGCGAKANSTLNSTPAGSSANKAESITNIGSDTMVNLALAWAETYHALHPEISVSITGGGSGTGIAALINGTVDIANASRMIKAEELADADKHGLQPQEFVVARDAIAVVVHPTNPIDRLTLAQISAIYSGKIDNWSELGGEDRPIVRLSRETNSGTHVYFLETVLRLGNKDDHTLFSTDTLLMQSSEGIIVEVSQNPNAIGSDGLGYVTEDMKVLAIARSAEGPFVLPSVATVNDSSYPIARDLYMYTPVEPTGAVKAYLDWVRQSTEAQAIVSALGFVPVLP
jgi:phosphate transport system substrate-binding protein